MRWEDIRLISQALAARGMVIRVASPDVGYVSKLHGSQGAAAHVEGSKHGIPVEQTEPHNPDSYGQA